GNMLSRRIRLRFTFATTGALFSSVIVYLVLIWFKKTATTEIYTLSLHDALPIWLGSSTPRNFTRIVCPMYALKSRDFCVYPVFLDRKSTRLNSSHVAISYAVFCLKKKNNSPHTNFFMIFFTY